MHVKICGITNINDAQTAAHLGVDALGFNFYPQSKRYISPDNAQHIIRALPPFVDPVGLFVNQQFADVIAWAESFGSIHTLQIHADSHEVIPVSSFHFIPAFSIRDKTSLTHIDAYLQTCKEGGQMPSAILVDAHVRGEYGGTGQTAPWHLLAEYRSSIPLILAGGLTPENVAEAVRIVQPYAVDVASGVESAPGMKDVEKMRRFIGNANDAAK